MSSVHNIWPKLPPLEDWQDTLTTVHMWSQVIGKIRLTLSPWINHSWGCALYVSTSGLTTSPIPYRAGTFAIEFDFVNHQLRFNTSVGGQRSFSLEPMTVADFYKKTLKNLGDLAIDVTIFKRPVEVVEAIPFDEDKTHKTYDAAAINSFWQALVQITRVFTEFRARFLGKVSPVHFFWGAFDLAVTRFSGRPAPKHPGGAPNVANWVMEEAYSHEVSSAGFWAGPGLGEAAFYSYAYPAPDGYKDSTVAPAAAYYHESLGEFLLPYEAVRKSAEPDQTLLSFLQTTYEAAANLGSWDRAALEQSAQYPPK